MNDLGEITSSVVAKWSKVCSDVISESTRNRQNRWPVISDKYEGDPYQMICGLSEAAQFKYHMKRQGNRVWLWKDGPGAAENVYVGSDNPDHRSDGFGGRTLTFELVEGGSIDLYGPWHGNADSMFKATGVDIRDTYRTFVVVGLGCGCGEGMSMIITDVVYQDEEWKDGGYDRSHAISQKIANDLGRTVQCLKVSKGGSSRGPVNPQVKDESQE